MRPRGVVHELRRREEPSRRRSRTAKAAQRAQPATGRPRVRFLRRCLSPWALILEGAPGSGPVFSQIAVCSWIPPGRALSGIRSMSLSMSNPSRLSSWFRTPPPVAKRLRPARAAVHRSSPPRLTSPPFQNLPLPGSPHPSARRSSRARHSRARAASWRADRRPSRPARRGLAERPAEVLVARPAPARGEPPRSRSSARFPITACSAISVNCETTSAAPPVSSSERSKRPSSAAKMRRLRQTFRRPAPQRPRRPRSEDLPSGICRAWYRPRRSGSRQAGPGHALDDRLHGVAARGPRPRSRLRFLQSDRARAGET